MYKCEYERRYGLKIKDRKRERRKKIKDQMVT